jgi:uncharacterized protein (DUF1684 family)
VRAVRLALIASALTAFVSAADPYAASIEKWRQQREARLKSDDGWLSVTGLFWLKEGENSAGSGEGSEVKLEKASAPERVGSFGFRGGKAVFVAERGAGVTLNGKPVTTLAMRPDSEGQPDILAVGGVTMHVIKRGDRYGIRVRDRNSRFRREFRGLEWFPVNEGFRVTARWVPYKPPKRIPIPNVLGDTELQQCSGYVAFTLNGTEHRLEPVDEDGKLWFIFKDATSRKETYPAGRFLYADPPKEGKVVLDFNKAYNPPCAFTPYATCPLPPKQNQLPVTIPAGEKRYGH